MQIIRLFILSFFCTYLFAFNGGPIPPEIIQKAERKYGGIVVSRFVEYNKMLKRAEHFSLQNKLETVNNFFNEIPFKSDIENWKTEDYWATPFEFLARYNGDSEDYVIAKYFALETLGVSSKNLYFTYVNSNKFDEPHMVLSYFKSLDSDPFILDNINHEILNASERDDLTPIYNFNPSTSEDNKIKQDTHQKWLQLYQRVKRNKL